MGNNSELEEVKRKVGRKIVLFLCNRFICWLSPSTCIRRQDGEDVEEILPACAKCSQGRGIKTLIESDTYFKIEEG